jgi:hypothetical protein
MGSASGKEQIVTHQAYLNILWDLCFVCGDLKLTSVKIIQVYAALKFVALRVNMKILWKNY